MLRRVMLLVGVLCTLGVIAVSMSMNFLFGYGFGATVEAARVWGGLSVVSDGLKAVLPVAVAHQGAQRHWGRALAGVLIFPLVLAYGFMSALGFSAQSRGILAAGGENAAAAYEQVRADLRSAEDELAGLGRQRLPQAVKIELSRLKRERMWEESKGCAEARGNMARAFCKKVDALATELLTAEQAVAVKARIEVLKQKVEERRPVGPRQLGDLQVASLEWVFGGDRQQVATGLSWLSATLVELISAFGLLVVDQARKTPKAQVEQEAPWKLVGEAEEDEGNG